MDHKRLTIVLGGTCPAEILAKLKYRLDLYCYAIGKRRYPDCHPGVAPRLAEDFHE